MTSPAGANLPDHVAAQIDFAAHIRNPEVNPRPVDIEARRMQIYLDLFYNNIENFLSSAYPVAKSCFVGEDWHSLVRSFVHSHASESPYFLEISQEFLEFLGARGLAGLPPFLLELCHYEWVELALDVAQALPEDEQTLDSRTFRPLYVEADYCVSGVALPLAYRYAVQEIGPDHQPKEAPPQPTYLIVYRTPELDVRFMSSNAVTHRLLGLLESACLQNCLSQIFEELVAAGQDITYSAVEKQGREIMQTLSQLGIIRLK